MAFQWNLAALETLMAEEQLDQGPAILRTFSVVELWRVRRVCRAAWSTDHRVLFIQMYDGSALGKFPSQCFAERNEIIDVFTKRPVAPCLP